MAQCAHVITLRAASNYKLTALRGDAEDTPLQGKLNRLADLIAWAGMIAGLVLFVGLMIRFFVQLGTGEPAMTVRVIFSNAHVTEYTLSL